MHPAQRSLTAENVVSERRTVENPVLKFVVYTVGRRILVEIYLIENHVLLLLYLMFRKSRAENDVGYQFHRLGVVASQGSGMHHGLFLGRIGVEFSTHVLQPTIHLPGFPPLRPLEQRVFYKMGHAVFAGQLVAAAGIYGQGTMYHRRFDLFEDASDAVGQGICDEFH